MDPIVNKTIFDYFPTHTGLNPRNHASNDPGIGTKGLGKFIEAAEMKLTQMANYYRSARARREWGALPVDFIGQFPTHHPN